MWIHFIALNPDKSSRGHIKSHNICYAAVVSTKHHSHYMKALSCCQYFLKKRSTVQSLRRSPKCPVTKEGLYQCISYPFLGNMELQKTVWVHICMDDIRLNNVSRFGTLANVYINCSNVAGKQLGFGVPWEAVQHRGAWGNSSLSSKWRAKCRELRWGNWRVFRRSLWLFWEKQWSIAANPLPFTGNVLWSLPFICLAQSSHSLILSGVICDLIGGAALHSPSSYRSPSSVLLDADITSSLNYILHFFPSFSLGTGAMPLPHLIPTVTSTQHSIIMWQQTKHFTTCLNNHSSVGYLLTFFFFKKFGTKLSLIFILPIFPWPLQ